MTTPFADSTGRRHIVKYHKRVLEPAPENAIESEALCATCQL
jgi:hypothetical protein